MMSGTIGSVGTLAVLAAMAVLGLAADLRADVTLVDGGKTDYVILLSTKAGPSQKFAAQELAGFVKQISGAELKIVERDSVLTNRESDASFPEKSIQIGYDFAETGLAKPRQDLGPDGFLIATSNAPHVVIVGGKRGTLYGVYTLIEDWGVRWWTPSETFVPALKKLTLPDKDRLEIPRLEYRDMMFNEGWSEAGKLWMARNKVNGMTWESLGEKTKTPGPDKLGDRYRFVGNLVHSYMHLLERSGVKVTEDMMSLVDGKRTSGESAQPCLSNQKVFEAMVVGVLKAFQETPDAGFVVVGQMDNGNYCRCPDCAAIDEAEGSHAGQVIRFANRVAEEVEKRRPGSAICTAAYEWSRKPPKTIKPRDNVYITLCSIECDFAHPLADGSNPENQAFKDDIQGWARIAKKIIIWHYVGNRDHYLQPNAELETLAPNMKFFADNHAAGIFNQGTHRGSATDMTMLKQWVLARSMWNPEADSRKLIEEFCRGYYGPAGDDILKYIDIIHAPAHARQFHNGRRVHLDAPYLRPEIVAEAEAALRAAEAKVPADGDLGRRVRHAHMGIWYVLAKRGPGSVTWKVVEAHLGEKVDPTAIAANLARVVKESGVNCICDPDPVGPWIQWLTAYMAKAKESGGWVLPLEFKDWGVDLSKVRLVQANQLDMTPNFWKPVEGASDGYAAVITGPGWYTVYDLSPAEDYAAGKSYKLCVRAKGDLKPDAAGPVWEFGVHPKGQTVRVEADKLKDGQWHVFELGPWKAAEDQRFWSALIRNPTGANSVAIDCIWLVETPKN